MSNIILKKDTFPSSATKEKLIEEKKKLEKELNESKGLKRIGINIKLASTNRKIFNLHIRGES